MDIGKNELLGMSFYQIAERYSEDFKEEIRRHEEEVSEKTSDGAIAVCVKWINDDTGEILSIRTYNKEEFQNLLSEWG